MAAWIECSDCQQYVVRVRPPLPPRVRCLACQQHYDAHEGVVHRTILTHLYTLECRCCGGDRFLPDAHEDELIARIDACRDDNPTASVDELCQLVCDELHDEDAWSLCADCDHVWNKDD